MKYLLLMVLLVAGCATEKGNQRQAQHSADQIRIVAVQKEAQVKREQAQAQANAQLYDALARVAESNPDLNGPAVAVALAVIGVSGGTSSPSNTDRPVALLQRPQESEALRWAEALAPTVGGLVTGLGTAAISASVAKNASDNARAVSMNQDNQNAAVIESVASLGREALVNAGDNYAGDYYSLSDDAFVDNSVTNTTTSTSTTTSVSDSYNSADENFTQGDYGFFNSGEYEDPYTETTTTNSLTNTITSSTTVTYGGSEMTLGELINYLAGLGTPYSLSIGGEVVASSTSGDGPTTTVNCTDGPQFSPQHPDCT